MRLRRPVGVSGSSIPAVIGFELKSVSEKFMVALLMYESARVKAPAIWVVVVVEMSDSVVVNIRLRNETRRLRSMRAKGRYL